MCSSHSFWATGGDQRRAPDPGEAVHDDRPVALRLGMKPLDQVEEGLG
jgi:hypothetical protein